MKTFDSTFWVSITVYTLLIGLICCFPAMFIGSSGPALDFTKTGEIGDTIGGIMGPFIAIAASLLTFLAFWVQYKANIHQREQFNIQLKTQKDQFETQIQAQHTQVEKQLAENRTQRSAQELVWKIEQFESKYYELIRLHRANVEEINIGNVAHGRKAFGSMFYEYKACFLVLEQLYQEHLGNVKEFTPQQLGNISFKIFYYGIGGNSNLILGEFFKDEEKLLVHNLIPRLRNIQNNFSESSGTIFTISSIRGDFILRMKYIPFDGHSTKLGHYFRHLYQTVDFVAKCELFDEAKKYEYIKTLRAQLSNHEQLLLYYDALSDFGKKWIHQGYLTRYRLIRNIPLPLADFGDTPERRFAKEISSFRKIGKEFFEWHER